MLQAFASDGIPIQYDVGDSVWAFAVDPRGAMVTVPLSGRYLTFWSPDGDFLRYIGSGTRGNKDGKGYDAEFEDPSSIAVSPDGSFWLTDWSHTVRRISQNGHVSTIAGGGIGAAGFTDGRGVAASFQYPEAIALDPEGNAIVADPYNRALRKVTPTGEVTTITQGNFDDATANLSDPYRIAVGGDGVVWASDRSGLLWRVKSQTEVSEVRPSDEWASARMRGEITSLAADQDGNCWVALGFRIVVISPQGNLIFSLPMPFFPELISLDGNGHIYIYNEITIQKFHVPGKQMGMMRSLCEPDDIADVCFRVGASRTALSAHRQILMMTSEYFKNMFRSNFKEGANSDVSFEHVRYTVFKTILVYLYTEILDVVREDLLETAAKADEFQISELLRACVAYSKKKIDKENALVWLAASEKHKLEGIRSVCLDFVVENVVDIVDGHRDKLAALCPISSGLVEGFARKMRGQKRKCA